jgi:hypothetical protein
MRTCFLLLLALAACGDNADTPQAVAPEELANQIEAIHEARPEKAPQRLAYLREADLSSELRALPGCRFEQGGQILLIVNAAVAVARVDNERVPLAVSGPVGPTGGFFTAHRITLSVGRTTPPPAGTPSAGAAWPAQVTLAGKPEVPPERHEGTWLCTVNPAPGG